MIELFLLGAAAGAVVKARQARPARVGPRRRRGRAWELPGLDVLASAPRPLGGDLGGYGETLISGLSARGLEVRLAGTVTGPSVVRYELDLGDARLSRLTGLTRDIGYLLGASNPRILTPVDGRSVVGIEVPRRERELVTLASVLGRKRLGVLDVAIGLTTDAMPVMANLAQLHHVLVAGATGAGKSTFLNSLIVSLLVGASPKDLQLLLIDPKRVELSQYAGLPHLWRPIAKDGGDAIIALVAVVEEMNRRYAFMERKGFRNIAEARAKGVDLPYLVVIIDEVAELMMVAREHVEPAIAGIARLGRGAGIHLVPATQRPDVKVITGEIKANIPARVAFAVASNTDSRVILDANGAENLTGKGDLLFSTGGHELTRAQGAYVTDDEIRKVVQWWIKQR